MDDYTIIILVTLFGFLALAAILLVPVYRFLQREERASRRWTADGVAPSPQRPRASAEGDSAPAGEKSTPSEESAGSLRDAG